MILTVLLGAAFLSLTYRVLENGFALKPGQVETNLNGQAVVLAIASIAAGVYLVGPLAGVALVLGIAIHEYGHVAAYRAMGHTDARFRLIPFMGGVAISNQIPKTHLADFYISIMGPGIMLAPLVICGLIIDAPGRFPYPVTQFAYTMFVITGVINFFNLLPLWPLDGGRIVRTITHGFWPQASPLITRGMALGLGFWAAYTGRWIILMVAIFGWISARQIKSINARQVPMTSPQALVATIAYVAAMAAHGLAGAPLIMSLLFPPAQG